MEEREEEGSSPLVVEREKVLMISSHASRRLLYISWLTFCSRNGVEPRYKDSLNE
jgi:uncharacterized membrane protein